MVTRAEAGGCPSCEMGVSQKAWLLLAASAVLWVRCRPRGHWAEVLKEGIQRCQPIRGPGDAVLGLHLEGAADRQSALSR